MKKISQEVLDEVQKHVNDYDACWTHGVCALVIIDKESGRASTGHKKGHICHAPILSLSKKGHLIVNGHKKQWQKVAPDYIKWVATESPFAHGVVNRDNLKEIFNHASVFDTEEIGKGGALWLGKAFRYFVEDDWKPGIWNKLREEGLTGLQAFIGTSILNAAGEPMCYSHVNLVGYREPRKLREIYDELLKTKRNDTTAVAKGTGVWGAKPEAKCWGSLVGKEEKKPDGWGGFTMVKRPCSPKEYAAQLKEIFEGDPKNVG